MRDADRNGIVVGIVFGGIMSVYQYPDAPIARRLGYIIGVSLVCWALSRCIASFMKPPLP